MVRSPPNAPMHPVAPAWHRPPIEDRPETARWDAAPSDSDQGLPNGLEKRRAITGQEPAGQAREAAWRGAPAKRTIDEWHIARCSQVRPQPSTIGPKGDVPPWTAKPSKPARSERIKVFLAKVVLPTPASPASRTSDPCPAAASVTHASSWARSGSRADQRSRSTCHAVILWRNARSPPLSDPRQLHRSTSSTPRFAWLPRRARSSRSSSRYHRAAPARSPDESGHHRHRRLPGSAPRLG